MAVEAPITLKEVQLRLGVAQHVLIHLCETGVIEPDFSQTSGRGKRREFSERNLFEFAVALALRKIELPVARVALLVRVLRAFARALAKASPGVVLPGGLVGDDLKILLYLYGADQLVLSGRGSALRGPVLLCAKIGTPHDAPRVTQLDQLPKIYETRVEINLSEIARSVLGELPR
jgi:hypothetical protein